MRRRPATKQETSELTDGAQTPLARVLTLSAARFALAHSLVLVTSLGRGTCELHRKRPVLIPNAISVEWLEESACDILVTLGDVKGNVEIIFPYLVVERAWETLRQKADDVAKQNFFRTALEHPEWVTQLSDESIIGPIRESTKKSNSEQEKILRLEKLLAGIRSGKRVSLDHTVYENF